MDNTLVNLSCEVIRKNWNICGSDICNTPFFDIVWNDWENKHNTYIKCIYYSTLKSFILQWCNNFDKSEEKIILNNLDTNDRKNVHMICDVIGLHHKSKFIKRKKCKKKKTHIKNMHIYKPKIWLWEFTEKNPFSNNTLVYAHQHNTRNAYLERKYCNYCDKTGLETQLFSSVYIRELYCNDCLETLSDGERGKLSCHKFEPI